MANLQLTFPVFYHCAIKKASPYTQYNAVNLLLTGSMKDDTVRSIPESTASLYANGTKPLPKDTIYELLQLSDNDLYDRFQALNFSDIFATTEALARLLEVVSISSSAKDQLLRYNTPEMEYDFLIQVFRAALKNSAFHTVRLSKEDLARIQSCREPAPQPLEDPAPKPEEEPAPQPLEEPAPHAEPKEPSSLFARLKPISPDGLEELEAVRTIGSLRPPIDPKETGITDSYLKFMAELDDSGTNPLDPLGDYEDHLLIRTLFPSAHVSREELLNAFYSLIDSGDDEPPFLAIDYADLMSVVQDTDAGDLFVLECMGREEEVLHYLTRQPSLSGTKSAAMIAILSPHASMDLSYALSTAVLESLGHDMLLLGVRLSAEIGEGQACVRLFLAC